jgi:hypothetical protein
VRAKGSRARWIPSPAPPKAPSRKGTSSVGQSTIRQGPSSPGGASGWQTIREERDPMRKRISLLFAALMLALTMSFGGVAFAQGGGIRRSVRTRPAMKPRVRARPLPSRT